MSLRSLIIFTTCVLSGVASVDFSKNLLECIKHYEINVCLRSTLEELRKYMPVGIPELGLNVSEPLMISNLHFKREKEPIELESFFKNVVVNGLSTFQTDYINLDPRAKRISLQISIPEIGVKGEYKTKGHIFILTITGHGPFQAKMYGVKAKGEALIDVVKGDEVHKTIAVRNTSIDIDIEDIKIQIENLLGENEELFTESINEFLNQNSHPILQELKPQIQERLIKMVEKVLNEAFSKISATELIENIEASGGAGNAHLRFK